MLTRFQRWGLGRLQQAGLLRLRLCSAGFQLAKRSAADLTRKPEKKIPKFRPWLMWAKGFFYDIIVSWHYITIYQSLINNGFSPRIKIYSWSGLKAWLHNSCPIHLPCQQNKGQNSISWAVFGSFWNCKIWSALVCRPKTDYAETASRTFFKAGKHRQADYCMEKFRQ